MSRKSLVIALGIAAPLIAAGAYFLSPAGTPPGQPALATIGENTLAGFQAEFNQSSNTARLVLLLSPTCPTCLEGASSVEKILKDHSQPPVTVFAVWEPILPTDWAPPGRLALRRLGDARVRQYWDPRHLIATEFKESGQKWKRQPDCCELNGFLWDLAAVFAPGEQWRNGPPEPTFVDGTIVGSSSDLATILARR
jgi:hypothetical protein